MDEPLEPLEPFAPSTPLDATGSADPLDLTELSASSPPRRHPRLRVMIAAGLATVLAGGGVAFAALNGGTTNRPEDAVRGLLTAASNGDLLGVLDHLDPAETSALVGPLRNSTTELERLGVLSDGADLSRVGGVKASFTITTSTENLRPDLVAVTITGGSVHGRVDPAQLPIGSMLREIAGAALTKAKPVEASRQLDSAHLPPLLTVERNTSSGRQWFVSIGYTIADNARRSANLPMPAVSASIPAKGADQPTQAVDEFLRAAAAFDIRRLVELTPPQEMAALHDYAPLFLNQATTALDEPGAERPTVKVNDLRLSAAVHGSTALVTVDSLDVSGTSGTSHFAYRTGDKCVTVTGVDPSSTGISRNQISVAAPGAGSLGICGDGPTTSSDTGGDPLAPVPTLFGGGLDIFAGVHPTLGIAVEKASDGKWYVSPVRTVLDDAVAVLHALPADGVQKIYKSFTTASRSVSSSSEAVDPTFPPEPVGAIGSSVMGPCVNGTRTVKFDSTGGPTPPPPPVTIPC
jgi:hypothetical protein